MKETTYYPLPTHPEDLEVLSEFTALQEPYPLTAANCRRVRGILDGLRDRGVTLFLLEGQIWYPESHPDVTLNFLAQLIAIRAPLAAVLEDEPFPVEDSGLAALAQWSAQRQGSNSEHFLANLGLKQGEHWDYQLGGGRLRPIPTEAGIRRLAELTAAGGLPDVTVTVEDTDDG